MSAVAALAVASPVAVVAVAQFAPLDTTPAPQHREFVHANLITDLPAEIMAALTQALAQFDINLPPMPGTGLLTGAGTEIPSLASTSAIGGTGSTPVVLPPVTDSALTDTTMTNPELTPATPSAVTQNPTSLITDTPASVSTPGGLTTQPIGPDSAFSPLATSGLPNPGEISIAAPIGLDGYPVDPSLATLSPTTDASGGLLSRAAEELGVGQAIDLLKGIVMPAIQSAIKQAAPVAADAAAAAPAAVETAPGA